MKLPPFIYTHRWFIIIGLATTLGCLIGVLVYIGFQIQDADAENSVKQESSSSAQQSTESASTAAKNKTNEISQGAKASTELENSATDTMAEVKAAIEAKNGQKLYDLLGSDMKAIFTPESVTSAFAKADGITITPVDEIKLNSEWAKQDVESVDSAGQTMRFRVVLHLEDGEWKLFGTEKLS